MPHIALPEGFPGIRSLMMYRPDTAIPLSQLVQILLYDPSTMNAGERELIATYVSNLNACHYCASAHGAIARHHLREQASIVEQVLDDPQTAPISEKLKALLQIAALVQQNGKKVTEEAVSNARATGATDQEIHDTVLIAAAFCMFNRYVDGLATWTPDDPQLYDRIGRQRAQEGYLSPPLVMESAKV